MNQSEEIKNKLDIVEVVGSYIHLKPSGSGHKALCPFHKEKSPSFVVSSEKQIFHCFGCGKGGDVFTFVMEMEGVDFYEAMKILANKAGVTLKKEDAPLKSKRARLLAIMDLASKYYHKALTSTSRGQEMQKYLFNRGLTEDTIQEWRLGYSPESWDNLINFLKEKKFREDEIAEAGLSIKKENTSHYYNRFRDRVMFPISDINSNIVAFTARVNPNKEETEKMGKYINSPQTEIYDKSKIVFGLDKAKLHIKEADKVLVVEGQMDVITAFQHGFKNVVASSGTALTSQQLQLIKRYTHNLILAFDMDKAGQMAADRGIWEGLKMEMNLQVLVLEQGKDPDEYIKNNPEGFKEAIAKAKPVIEYYIFRIKKEFEDEMEQRKQVEKVILPLLAQMSNEIERGYWIKEVSFNFDIAEEDIREQLRKKKESSFSKVENKTEPEENSLKPEEGQEAKTSRLLLSLLLNFPDLIPYSINNLEANYLFNDENRLFYNQLIIYYNEYSSYDYESFSLWLKEQGEDTKLLDQLSLLSAHYFGEITDQEAKTNLINLIAKVKSLYFKEKRKELQRKIALAEKEQDLEKLEGLLEKFKEISDLQNSNLN